MVPCVIAPENRLFRPRRKCCWCFHHQIIPRCVSGAGSVWRYTARYAISPSILLKAVSRSCIDALLPGVDFPCNAAISAIYEVARATCVRIVGFSDAAFANNHDLKSQLDRIILLMDDKNAAIPITLKSYKSRRVARSFLSAEVIVFADLLDDALSIRSQLEHALWRLKPMHLLTDSKSLYDIISKGTSTNEKRNYVRYPYRSWRL